MTREVAKVYNALPPDERARTAIFANSYGQAGAIDFFGPKYGLPKAISNHQNYWYWGPRDYDGSTVIVLGSDGEGDREHFKTVEPVGRTLSSLLTPRRTLRHLPLPRPQPTPPYSLAEHQEVELKDANAAVSCEQYFVGRAFQTEVRAARSVRAGRAPPTDRTHRLGTAARPRSQGLVDLLL